MTVQGYMHLADFMRERDLKDHQVADELGVSRETVTRWRRGDRTPEDEFVERIVKYTGGEVTVADLRPALADAIQYQPKQAAE